LIWTKTGDYNEVVDELNRKIISFRWVMESLKHNFFISRVKSMHLCPLPRKVPIEDFKNTVIEFTCIDKPESRELFKELAELYGFTRKLQDGLTTHIVVWDEESVKKSKTIYNVNKSFKKGKMPHIVKVDWFIDSMNLGKI
jgi:BRCA1 C Terminus (BRCT) domain